MYPWPLATRGCRFDSFKRSIGMALKLDLNAVEGEQPSRRLSRVLSEAGECRESMGRHLLWAPHASDHQLSANLHDIITAIAAASGRKLRWLEKDTGHRSSVSVLWRRLSRVGGRIGLRPSAPRASAHDAQSQAHAETIIDIRPGSSVAPWRSLAAATTAVTALDPGSSPSSRSQAATAGATVRMCTQLAACAVHSPHAHEAAAKIQALHRGRVLRMRLARLMKAVIKLQALHRGRTTRKVHHSKLKIKGQPLLGLRLGNRASSPARSSNPRRTLAAVMGCDHGLRMFAEVMGSDHHDQHHFMCFHAEATDVAQRLVHELRNRDRIRGRFAVEPLAHPLAWSDAPARNSSGRRFRARSSGGHSSTGRGADSEPRRRTGSPEESAAATRIQSVYRGKLARIRVGEKEAAETAHDQLVSEILQRLGVLAEARSVLLLQTKNVCCHPVLCLELYYAITHDIPITPVHVGNGGYNFADALRHLNNFETVAAAAYPRAWAAASDVMARQGILPRKVQWVLGTEIPSIISVSLRTSGSESLFHAACDDIEERLTAEYHHNSAFSATQASCCELDCCTPPPAGPSCPSPHPTITTTAPAVATDERRLPLGCGQVVDQARGAVGVRRQGAANTVARRSLPGRGIWR